MHPSLFAAVDGDGFIDLWDINKDKESPIVHKKAFETQSGGQTYKDFDDTKAISTLKWSKDGRKIAIGDQDGFVSIWNIEKDIAIPKQADFDMMEQLIEEFSQDASKRKQNMDKDFD